VLKFSEKVSQGENKVAEWCSGAGGEIRRVRQGSDGTGGDAVRIHGVDSIQKKKKKRTRVRRVFGSEYGVGVVRIGLDVGSPSEGN